jgi:hypothetical protein
VRTYYRKFAKQASFGVLTRNTKTLKGERRYLILICTRGRLEPTSTTRNSSKPQGVVLGFMRQNVMMKLGF